MAEQEERIAQRLRKLRADTGHPTRPGRPLPADLAAEKAGVKYRQWQRWEQGRTMPRSTSLEQVAEAFGLDVAEFYETEDGQPLSQLDRIEANTEEILRLLRGEDEATIAAAAELEDRLPAELSEADAKPTRRAPARSAKKQEAARRNPS